MTQRQLLVGVDLGAGVGAKLGLFADTHTLIGEGVLPLREYGGSAENLTGALIDRVDRMLRQCETSMDHVRAIGIVSAGLLRSDGSYLLASNLPFLNGANLKSLVEERIGLPTGIENDANAGGLAEWNVLRLELLYWVFGGGWGGAWIGREGIIRFPATDWDGDDASLHYTNEPGYAIPLEKITIKNILLTHGVSYDRFEQVMIEDLQPEDGVLRGPSGNPDTIRAEMILSGPGRCRLFRVVVADDDFYERFLDIHETREMSDPAVAGKHISKLSSMRVDAAITTDRIFGRLLAHATRMMVRQAERDGIAEGLPICLGGKPSYALPYFGPSAQRALGAMGLSSYLRPSVIDERGSNANLAGAAVLADQTALLREGA